MLDEMNREIRKRLSEEFKKLKNMTPEKLEEHYIQEELENDRIVKEAFDEIRASRDK